MATRIVLVVLACATFFSLVYVYRQRQQTHELAANNQTLATSVAQLQTELRSTMEKLAQSQTAAAEPPPARAAKPVKSRAKTRQPARPIARSKPAGDPRLDQLQSDVSDQRNQIARTRDELASARQELQGNINSSHDELSGSIARTHEEVVALAKRGERSYFEFKIDKSKKFQHVGSLSLSLRKVNLKRKAYDLALLVDDNELQKKSVNLFEPVWISVGDKPQAAELVVNRIAKDEIQGYLSEPKYKTSELKDASPQP